MMEAAESRDRHDAATRVGAPCGHSSERCLLRKTKMSPVVMVVADIFGHETLEMPLVEPNHVIEQIPAAVAKEALGHTVLPWTAEGGPLRLDAETVDSTTTSPLKFAARSKVRYFGAAS